MRQVGEVCAGICGMAKGKCHRHLLRMTIFDYKIKPVV
jgi:hypothetical protein